MKKQSNLSRLLDYAGTYRILTYLSWVLAAAGALLALVPFGYIWRILREVIEVAPRYENAVHVTQYGWMAVAFAVVAVLTYIAGLMCSHLAAFRIATNLRLAMVKHIATLPLPNCGAPSPKPQDRRKLISPTNCRIRRKPWRPSRGF